MAARQNGGQQSEDSVAEEFGHLYSEDTLDLMRRMGKMPWQEEQSSLDPEEDFETFVMHGLRVPPRGYDKLQERAQKAEDAVAQLKQQQYPTPNAVEVAEAKLLTGKTPADAEWMRLKGYQKAVAMKRAEQRRQQQQQQQQQQEQQMAAQGAAASAASTSAAAAAPDLESSEDSEWVAGWNRTGYLPYHPTTDVATSVLTALRTPPAPEPTPLLHDLGKTAAEIGARQAEADAMGLGWNVATSTLGQQPYRQYTEAYAAQVALKHRVQQQQVQRSRAFWISFGAVLALSTLRWMRNRVQSKRPPAPPPAAPSRAGGGGADSASVASSAISRQRAV